MTEIGSLQQQRL